MYTYHGPQFNLYKVMSLYFVICSLFTCFIQSLHHTCFIVFSGCGCWLMCGYLGVCVGGLCMDVWVFGCGCVGGYCGCVCIRYGFHTLCFEMYPIS